VSHLLSASYPNAHAWSLSLQVGAQLVASSDVHMVAMTGSSAVGKRVMEACAPSLKRLVLELGGKDPMVNSYWLTFMRRLLACLPW